VTQNGERLTQMEIKP